MRPVRVNRVSISLRYIKQNVTHSSPRYCSHIEPLGLSRFRTYYLKCPKVLQITGSSKFSSVYDEKLYLSIGYIHQKGTGPPNFASSVRFTIKCTITVKKDGGKNISIRHKVTKIWSCNLSSS